MDPALFKIIAYINSGTTFFKLPCGELSSGEGEEEGLVRIINTTLGREDGINTDWAVTVSAEFNQDTHHSSCACHSLTERAKAVLPVSHSHTFVWVCATVHACMLFDSMLSKESPSKRLLTTLTTPIPVGGVFLLDPTNYMASERHHVQALLMRAWQAMPDYAQDFGQWCPMLSEGLLGVRLLAIGEATFLDSVDLINPTRAHSS